MIPLSLLVTQATRPWCASHWLH